MSKRAVATIAGLGLTLVLPLQALAGITVVEEEPPRFTGHAGLEALALLPAASRSLLLEAAREPEMLHGVASLQRESSERFRVVLSDFTPHQQILAWQIVGHPALVDSLLAARSLEEVEAVLAGESDALARAGRELGASERGILRAIAELRAQTADEFERLVAGRSLFVQAPFRALVDDANALALLDRESRLIASVGTLYRHDPAETLRALDELADAALARDAAGLPGWEPGEPEQPATTVAANGPSSDRGGRTNSAGDAAVLASASTSAVHPTTGITRASVVPVSIWLSAAPAPLPGLASAPRRASPSGVRGNVRGAGPQIERRGSGVVDGLRERSLRQPQRPDRRSPAQRSAGFERHRPTERQGLRALGSDRTRGVHAPRGPRSGAGAVRLGASRSGGQQIRSSSSRGSSRELGRRARGGQGRGRR